MLYFQYMAKPAVISPRVSSDTAPLSKKASRKLNVSEAEIVRRALDTFSF
jgi:hypothetical protein